MLYHKIHKLDFHLLIMNHILDNLHNNYDIYFHIDNIYLVLNHFYNMMLVCQLMDNRNLLHYILNFHILCLMVLYIGDKLRYNFWINMELRIGLNNNNLVLMNRFYNIRIFYQILDNMMNCNIYRLNMLMDHLNNFCLLVHNI